MHKELLLLILLALAAASWGASFYKWVDEKGVTHFSELPPPGGRAQEVQKQVNSPATSDAGTTPATKNWQEKETEFRRRQIDRAEAARKQEEKESAAKHFQDRCMVARRSLRDIENASAVSTTNDKGERVYLDDQARAAEIQRRKKEIEANCDGR
ncbi:MAG: DUF4124 domain-containing protein [Candidatus Accumulibacter sp.]|uniref:DUF4124 domain-containing protein n=1 Tax=Candidatus Accumulibacter affinis TaxID=2954384 RepID=A0A935T662_9PROT|nr:DUF4124 domain-containing protein [Candidatus Accumulibacter affinis]